MGARRTINHYRETPSGHNYDDVLKRGKVFYRDYGIFEMVPFRNKENEIMRWSAEGIIFSQFKRPEGTRVYRFDFIRKRWIEITEQEG